MQQLDRIEEAVARLGQSDDAVVAMLNVNNSLTRETLVEGRAIHDTLRTMSETLVEIRDLVRARP